jgi:hypothetical protein
MAEVARRRIPFQNWVEPSMQRQGQLQPQVTDAKGRDSLLRQHSAMHYFIQARFGQWGPRDSLSALSTGARRGAMKRNLRPRNAILGKTGFDDAHC